MLTLSLKEFIKLNVIMDTIIKTVKCAELNTKIVIVVWNIQSLKII